MRRVKKRGLLQSDLEEGGLCRFSKENGGGRMVSGGRGKGGGGGFPIGEGEGVKSRIPSTNWTKMREKKKKNLPQLTSKRRGGRR